MEIPRGKHTSPTKKLSMPQMGSQNQSLKKKLGDKLHKNQGISSFNLRQNLSNSIVSEATQATGVHPASEFGDRFKHDAKQQYAKPQGKRSPLQSKSNRLDAKSNKVPSLQDQMSPSFMNKVPNPNLNRSEILGQGLLDSKKKPLEDTSFNNGFSKAFEKRPSINTDRHKPKQQHDSLNGSIQFNGGVHNSKLFDLDGTNAKPMSIVANKDCSPVRGFTIQTSSNPTLNIEKGSVIQPNPSIMKMNPSAPVVPRLQKDDLHLLPSTQAPDFSDSKPALNTDRTGVRMSNMPTMPTSNITARMNQNGPVVPAESMISPRQSDSHYSQKAMKHILKKQKEITQQFGSMNKQLKAKFSRKLNIPAAGRASGSGTTSRKSLGSKQRYQSNGSSKTLLQEEMHQQDKMQRDIAKVLRPQSYSKDRLLNSTFQTVHYNQVSKTINTNRSTLQRKCTAPSTSADIVPVKIIHLNANNKNTKTRIFPQADSRANTPKMMRDDSQKDKTRTKRRMKPLPQDYGLNQLFSKVPTSKKGVKQCSKNVKQIKGDEPVDTDVLSCTSKKTVRGPLWEIRRATIAKPRTDSLGELFSQGMGIEARAELQPSASVPRLKPVKVIQNSKKYRKRSTASDQIQFCLDYDKNKEAISGQRQIVAGLKMVNIKALPSYNQNENEKLEINDEFISPMIQMKKHTKDMKFSTQKPTTIQNVIFFDRSTEIRANEDETTAPPTRETGLKVFESKNEKKTLFSDVSNQMFSQYKQKVQSKQATSLLENVASKTMTPNASVAKMKHSNFTPVMKSSPEKRALIQCKTEKLINPSSINKTANCQLDSVGDLLNDDAKPKQFVCEFFLNGNKKNLTPSQQFKSSTKIFECLNQKDLMNPPSLLSTYKKEQKKRGTKKTDVLCQNEVGASKLLDGSALSSKKNLTSNEMSELIRPSQWNNKFREQETLQNRLNSIIEPQYKRKSVSPVPLFGPQGSTSDARVNSMTRNEYTQAWNYHRGKGQCQDKVNAFKSQIKIL